MTKALNTGSSIVFEASILHSLTAAGFSDEKAAFTRNAAIVIVGFAVRNDTLVVFELKGFIALQTGVVGLFHLASKHKVVLALSKNQRILIFTTSTLVLRVILSTVFNTLLANTIEPSESISTVDACFSIIHQTSNECGLAMGAAIRLQTLSIFWLIV